MLCGTFGTLRTAAADLRRTSIFSQISITFQRIRPIFGQIGAPASRKTATLDRLGAGRGNVPLQRQELNARIKTNHAKAAGPPSEMRSVPLNVRVRVPRRL